MDDLISRKVAIENYQQVCAIVSCDNCPFHIADVAFTDCRLEKWLKSLQSAQPERKKGKWIDPAAVDVYRCSVCEKYTKLEVPRLFYHYCPNCGAEMEGEEDA